MVDVAQTTLEGLRFLFQIMWIWKISIFYMFSSTAISDNIIVNSLNENFSFIFIILLGW